MPILRTGKLVVQTVALASWLLGGLGLAKPKPHLGSISRTPSPAHASIASNCNPQRWKSHSRARIGPRPRPHCFLPSNISTSLFTRRETAPSQGFSYPATECTSTQARLKSISRSSRRSGWRNTGALSRLRLWHPPGGTSSSGVSRDRDSELLRRSGERAPALERPAHRRRSQAIRRYYPTTRKWRRGRSLRCPEGTTCPGAEPTGPAGGPAGSRQGSD